MAVSRASDALQATGDVQQFRKSTDAALLSYQQALDLYRAVGARPGEANTYLSLGTIHGSQNRVQEMHQHFQKALALYQAMDDQYSLGRALAYYGDALSDLQDGEAVRQCYAKALSAWQARGLDDLIVEHIMPRLVRACGSPEAAEAYLHEQLRRNGGVG